MWISTDRILPELIHQEGVDKRSDVVLVKLKNGPPGGALFGKVFTGILTHYKCSDEFVWELVGINSLMGIGRDTVEYWMPLPVAPESYKMG